MKKPYKDGTLRMPIGLYDALMDYLRELDKAGKRTSKATYICALIEADLKKKGKKIS